VITDSHAHVFWKDYDGDRNEVLERARAAGVERMIIVGTNVETSRAARALCEAERGLYPTAGIHPHDSAAATAEDRAAIAELARDARCVAVGETGLDYFKRFSPPEAQVELFRWHLELARSLDKPVVVHARDAHDDVVAMLREARGARGVMHCYTMGERELPAYVELGMCISFAGVITYPKNDAIRAAARAVPLELLLVETDCPFLAPQGRRGQRNEPALVRAVLEELARVRGEPFDELARATSANAARLFGL
jgi:TatD DNase family protein